MESKRLDFISEKEAAKEIGKSVRWLANARRAGKIEYLQEKRGSAVFYRVSDFIEFMEKQRRKAGYRVNTNINK